MFRRLLTILGIALGTSGAGYASVITQGDFIAPNVINFESAGAGPLASQYGALGVTFINFNLDFYATSAAPASRVGLKFIDGSPATTGEVLFASTITRFGVDASTNPEDDTTLMAYLGNVLVGSAFFDTGGDGEGGSFLGIEFLTGFDRVVFLTTPVINGAIAIDNLRFENIAVTEVPEPMTISLFGVALLGAAVIRRNRRV